MRDCNLCKLQGLNKGQKRVNPSHDLPYYYWLDFPTRELINVEIIIPYKNEKVRSWTVGFG